MYDIKSQKILGSSKPVDGVWSIPFEFDPEEAELLSKRGKLYMVVDFESSPNVDLQLASKIVIDEIKESYYGDLDGTPLQALESALISGKEKLQEISDKNKDSISTFKFNVVCCVVWGRVLYIAQVGNSSALLVRDGDVLNVGHKTSGEVMTSSGLLNNDDVIIIGTSLFEKEYYNENLMSNLGDLENLIEQSSNSTALSSVIISFKKSLVPSKNDLASFVSSLKGNKKQSKSEDIEEENTTYEDEVASITSLNEVVDTEEDNKKEVPEEEKDNKKGGGEEINGKDKRGRKPKKLILGGILLFALLSITGTFMYFNFNKSDSTISTVESQNFREVFEGLESSNAALEDYLSLKSDIEQALEENPDNEELNNLLNEVESKIESLESSEDSASENLLFDFSTKNSDSSLNNLSQTPDGLLISDRGSSQAFLLSEQEGEVQINDIAAGESFLMAYFDGENYYLLNQDSVFVGSSIESLESYELSENVSNINDIAVYFGSIYTLEGGSIHKYELEGEVYTKSLWAEVEDGSPSSIAIDGSIFVTTSEGVSEYYTGELQDFSVESPESLSENSDIYTELNMSEIYVLSESNFYEINKDTGDLIETYELEENLNFSSFVRNQNTLYTAVGSRVYRFELVE